MPNNLVFWQIVPFWDASLQASGTFFCSCVRGLKAHLKYTPKPKDLLMIFEQVFFYRAFSNRGAFCRAFSNRGDFCRAVLNRGALNKAVN